MSLSRLHEASRDLYGALRDHLPADRGHCAEAVSIISALARCLGIEHQVCAGVRRLANNDCDQHHWVTIGDQVLHARDGVVELVGPEGFEAATRIAIRPPPTLR